MRFIKVKDGLTQSDVNHQWYEFYKNKVFKAELTSGGFGYSINLSNYDGQPWGVEIMTSSVDIWDVVRLDPTLEII